MGVPKLGMVRLSFLPPSGVSDASRRRAADILFATIGRVGREPQASGRHQARDLGTNLTRPTDKPLSPSDIKFATVILYGGRAVAATH